MIATMSNTASPFTVERWGESGGHCDCCGNDSHSVWGIVLEEGETVAAYWMHWTLGHLADPGANLDIVLGKWGDDTATTDRVAVSLLHRERPDGTPAMMVIDASDRRTGDGTLASQALRRNEVIGMPIAAQVFALVDAIYEQDDRFF